MDTCGNLRNIALAAHVDAGKTTLCERLLFHCRAISVMGNVDAGSAVMDFLPEEQKRGISISAAAISCSWQDVRFNLVDTPGHVDFSGEVERSLSAVDAAIVIVSAVDGVEAQTEAVWQSLDTHALPRLVFINKCDRSEGSFQEVLTELSTRLGAQTVLLTLPLFAQDKEGEAPRLAGVLPLLPISSDSSDQAVQQLREELLERVADADERFLAHWLEGNFSDKNVINALARATKARKLVPVCVGSALNNLGIAELLSAMRTLLPAPNIAPEAVTLPLKAQVFKIVWHGEQRFALLRLLQGKLSRHAQPASSDTTEPLTIELFRPDAERFLDLDEASAGDIVAVTGLALKAGDILSQNQVVSAGIPTHYPTVLSQSLEPYLEADYAPLGEALKRIADEDPSLEIIRDSATGTYLVSGLGELHLEILRERLRREFGLTIRAQAPQVLRKETILHKAEAEASCEQGAGFGSVRLRVAPLAWSMNVQIRIAAACQAQEDERLALQTALEAVLTRGVLAGWPCAGIGVEILAIGPSSRRCPEALSRAACEALNKAIEEAGPILLSPWMQLELIAPESCLGPALHLLQSLDARIQDVKELAQGSSLREARKRIVAEAALDQLKNFSTRLRSATGGRCHLVMRPKRFAPAPNSSL